MAKRDPVIVDFSGGAWSGVAENADLFPMVDKKVWNGVTQKHDVEQARLFVQRREIKMTHQSGFAVRFYGQRRAGVMTFSDSRNADPKSYAGMVRERLTVPELKALLSRWVGMEGAEKALWVVTHR